MPENPILEGRFWQCNSVSFIAAASIPTQSSLVVFYLLWRGLWRVLFQLILNCRDGILVFEFSIFPSAINVIS